MVYAVTFNAERKLLHIYCIVTAMAKELLTDVSIRNAKPVVKDKRLNDGGGLYLLIKPNGAKWWRFDYSIKSKHLTHSIFSVWKKFSETALFQPLPLRLILCSLEHIGGQLRRIDCLSRYARATLF
jgi:hypothetical protein